MDYDLIWSIRDALESSLWTGISLNVIMAMFFITGDRILHVSLNMKYSLYFSKRKTYIIITTTWIITLAISIGLGIFPYSPISMLINQIIVVYLLPVLTVIFAIFALTTYAIMFIKHVKPQRRFNRSTSSIITIFVNSQFFVSVLIIASYLVLTVLPALMQSFMADLYEYGWVSKYYTRHSLCFSTTVDPLIYIFLQKKVRKLFFQKVLCCFKSKRSANVHEKNPCPRRKEKKHVKAEEMENKDTKI